MNDAEGLVFIIEDDDDVRASARTLAEALGFAVQDFADAESYLQATDGRGGDCILLDYHLPGMSGLDLVEVLRGQGVQTPVIVITANGRHLAARAARAGVSAVLRKPLAAEGLAQWLGEIARKKARP